MAKEKERGKEKERMATIDEIHVAVNVPAGLSGGDVRKARRVLYGKTFLDRVGRAVRALFRGRPGLATVQVIVTR
jgi:hypothetical protein